MKDLDYDRLLKLRLAVARFGEMDLARWWNTKGQLGSLGAKALRRGFPRTHRFAQARSVFEVAAHRCAEVFQPPGCVTLWRLPAAIEEEFAARWEHWLDHAPAWEPTFQQLEQMTLARSLTDTLRDLGVVGESDLAAYSRLRRSPDRPAVQLPALFSGPEEVALLALGFARGEVGALVVPYARIGEA